MGCCFLTRYQNLVFRVMGIIIDPRDTNTITSGLTSKKLVVAGGCFDILHKGHLEFLRSARKEGDALLLFLESDQRIKEIKGNGRPVNTQKDRATILANLPFVDYVLPLKYMKNDKDYEILVKKLEPDIIAVTSGTRVFGWEREYMKETGGRIVEVMPRIKSYSTTNLVLSVKL